jgi:hypothetical protein
MLLMLDVILLLLLLLVQGLIQILLGVHLLYEFLGELVHLRPLHLLLLLLELLELAHLLQLAELLQLLLVVGDLSLDLVEVLTSWGKSLLLLSA